MTIFTKMYGVEEHPVHLTIRELEILDLLSQGQTNKDISKLIGRSVDTVKTHRYHLLKKLQARNVAMLIRKGFEFGLLARTGS